MAKLKEVDFCLENFRTQFTKFAEINQYKETSELELKYTHCLFLLGLIGNEQYSKGGKVLQDMGLSSTSIHVLGAIHGADTTGVKIHSKELEEIFRVSNPTMSGVLKRLETKGYIVRSADPDDARNKVIHITDKGLEIHKNAIKCYNKFREQYFRNFSEEEIDTLSNLLIKLLDSLLE